MMIRTADWPPVLLDLPESSWTLTEAGPKTRVRVAGYTLEMSGMAVATGDDGVQGAVSGADAGREALLLELYDPEEPWQTWRGFGAEYALYAVPAADQDGPVAADVEVAPDVWAGLVPDMEERDRKLVTVVVAGHCALHLEARRVVGPGQEFVAYPEDREPLARLAGWDGPYPTVRLADGDFILFAYPHGD